LSISHKQLILPLLQAISDTGKREVARTSDLYDAVAEQLDVPDAIRKEKIVIKGKTPYEISAFERNVRWAMQTAKLRNLIAPAGKPCWKLTDKGKSSLREALPGMVVTIFTTPKGVALFASCEDAIGHIDDGSVNLIFSSPPFPLVIPREYGNVQSDLYGDWFLRLAEHWPRKLANDGSLVVNLGDIYEQGTPFLSLYQERLLIRLQDELGLRLCQKFYWHSPTKLAVPKTWVAIKRVRVKPSVEQLYWLSASPEPYADNSQVLLPYSARMRRTIAQGGERRREHHPSGHALNHGAYSRDNGGSIPGNLLVIGPDPDTEYIKACRGNNLPPHPARFPRQLPAFFIKFLTRENDLVYDPLSGSGVTAAEAERLGRRWITSEKIYDYVHGAKYRFKDRTCLSAFEPLVTESLFANV
jgi:DNA modification methylase